MTDDNDTVADLLLDLARAHVSVCDNAPDDDSQCGLTLAFHSVGALRSAESQTLRQRCEPWWEVLAAVYGGWPIDPDEEVDGGPVWAGVLAYEDAMDLARAHRRPTGRGQPAHLAAFGAAMQHERLASECRDEE
ncbi:MAG: hypothetical protein IH985_03315 [Planctomycetes bacterium]|nr:hypothetical protein [Planctomycetota bacterium]